MYVISVAGSSREVMLWQDITKALVAVLVSVAKGKAMMTMKKDKMILL